MTTTIGTATEFLYTGPNPIQTGVAPGTMAPERAAVVRGRVLDKANAPLAGVTITVLDHPAFGRFHLAVMHALARGVEGEAPYRPLPPPEAREQLT